MPQNTLHEQVIAAFIEEFRRLKRQGERGLEQLRDEDFDFRLNEQQNSIGTMVRHLAGNMRSRLRRISSRATGRSRTGIVKGSLWSR